MEPTAPSPFLEVPEASRGVFPNSLMSTGTETGRGSALVQLCDFLDVIPAILQAPHRSMHCTYDEAADVMYVNFEPGAEAADSELGSDDIVVRYRGDEIIGLTILHASRRSCVNGK